MKCLEQCCHPNLKSFLGFTVIREYFPHNVLSKTQACLIKNLLLTVARIGSGRCTELPSCNQFPGECVRRKVRTFRLNICFFHIGNITLLWHYCQFNAHLPPGLNVGSRADAALADDTLLPDGLRSSGDVASTPI
ncbi:MAG: hypothetical protein PeribacterD2_0916 [Candidatus Peribacter riflensis]|nr:MAG: hypothetical protein PeribacterD2_0916 [Candidatus Peribacter riflensis]